MSAIEIVEVETAARRREFIAYPNRLYRGDPNYVAPLLAERKEFFDFQKNPFYRVAKVRLFLALRDGRITGRIATCVNYNHNDFHNESVGFFGFFDCPDNYEVASTLLRVAMITLKREGMEKMRGPMNFSVNHELGFLVDGFESPPVLMMTYNRPYLPKLAEQFGLKKVVDLLAFKLSKETEIKQRIRTVVEKLQKRSKIVLRSVRMSDFFEEVKRINKVFNAAWEHNWGFVPMSEDEFQFAGRGLKQIVDPDLVLIGEHEGEPVAFSLAVPDINQALIHLNGRLLPLGIFKLLWHTKIRSKIKAVRLMVFGVIPQYQKRGIDSMMYIETFNRAVAKGYQWAELSWVLETNDLMCRGAVDMGAVPYKRYRIVEMPL